LLVLACAIAIAYYALHLPEVQTSIAQEAIKRLSKALGGNISVGRAKIKWFDEVTFEDVNIKDLDGKDMIFVRELYVNCKSNFSFDPNKILIFDNNLDYVLLKSPDVKLRKDVNGRLNIDYWIAKINELASTNGKKDPNYVPKAFTIDQAYIQNGKIQLIDERKKLTAPKSFDINNFTFNDLQADLSNVYFLKDTVSFQSKTIKAIDYHSDLEVKNIQTHFTYTKKSMKLDNLLAQINKSVVKNKLHFYYESPAAFSDFFNKITIKADLKDTHLYSQDLGRFSAYLYKFEDFYTLNTSLTGRYVDLTAKDFNLKFGKNSILKGTGNFKGFPDINKTLSNITLTEGQISASDAKLYTTDPNQIKYIDKVQSLNLKGIYIGYLGDFKADFTANSPNIGNIQANVAIQNSQNVILTKYKTNLHLQDFNLGYLLDDERFKKINFEGNVSGEGFNGKNSVFDLDGKVPSFAFNNYEYKNIQIDGKLSQAIFDGFLAIEDPNLKGNLEGRIDYSNELNNYKFKGKINQADLKNLGILSDAYKIKSNVDVDLNGNEIDNWLGKVTFADTKLYTGAKVLDIDSIALVSNKIAENREIQINSEFFNFKILGGFQPTFLIDALGRLGREYAMYFQKNEQQRNEYYSQKVKGIPKNYDADYSIILKKSDPFFAFFAPDLRVAKNTNITGNISLTEMQDFTFYANVDSLWFKENVFYENKINFSVKKNLNSPEVISSIDYFSRNQKFTNGLKAENLAANAYWDQKNIIDFNTSIDQKDNNSSADVIGKIQFTSEGFDIKINPQNSSVVLLNDKWAFSDKNYVTVVGDKIEFDDLKLSNGSQSVSLNGILNKNNYDETVFNIRDLSLETIKPITNQDIGGVANGELRLKDFYGNTVLINDVHIENLNYRKCNFGTLTFSSIYDNLSDKLLIKSNLFKDFNEILRLNGSYDPKKPANPLALKGKVKNLDLKIFQGMVDGIFTDLTGMSEGDFTVEGKPLNPVFKGEININKGALKIVSSGTELYFDDKIEMNSKGFYTAQSGITLRDNKTNGNKAILKGGVYFMPNNKFGLDLQALISSKDGFKILNLPSNEKAAFYGNALATGDVRVDGDFDNIIVSGNLTSKKGTKITIPLDGGMQVDTKQEGIPFLKKISTADSLIAINIPKSKNNGVNLNFNLSFTPDAECEIIFDRLNNDVLNVFGVGRLSILYDTRGIFTINGPYEVVSGKYNFSFQNLASLRKFNLLEGSRIMWSGDPFEANIDMKAGYTAYIPINRITKSQDNTRYPVNVIVSLQDRLLTPTIKYNLGFDVKQIPIAYQSLILGFQEKLRNDEQQMSRNVSSILVFNDVFPDNLADAITQQFLIDNVSNILSNQIGVLANKLNSNLELGVKFGDFRDNLLNNMQINVSYKFLDDRIKLKGNSSFVNSLENQANVNSQGQLSIGGEIEYLLSSDGEYKFRLFSRSVPTNFYTFSSSGNVLVSGGNFVISRNFNSLQFKNKAKTFPLGVAKKENEVSMINPKDSSQLKIQ
jgi:TamB, inner membrane protein subunit of TAM complex